MEKTLLKQWAENLKGHDTGEGSWDSAEELSEFLQRNWDFSGTLADAKIILEFLA